MDRVGVRELRQNLSVYVRKVKQGESFIVTERGREVARLTPTPAADADLAYLVDRLGARAPEASLLALCGDPVAEAPAARSEQIISDLREERL